MAAESAIRDALMRKAAESSWSVSELTAEISGETKRSRDAVAKELVRLSEEKKLLLTEKSPYTSLLRYAFSPYSLWFWAALGATILSMALSTVSSGLLIYLRYVFGGALVLFLPGFSLIEFLYAKKGELDELLRIVFSIGLSLALTPLTDLVLNYTPFGIRLVPILASLAGLTVVFLLLAVRRKHAYYKLAKGIV